MKNTILLMSAIILTLNTRCFGQSEAKILLETNEVATGILNYSHDLFANNPLQRRGEAFEEKIVKECYELKKMCDKLALPFPLTNSLTKFQQIERKKYRIGSMTKANMARYEENCEFQLRMIKIPFMVAGQNANIPGGNLNAGAGVVGGGVVIPGPQLNILGNKDNNENADNNLNNLRAQQWRAARDLENSERNLRDAENKQRSSMFGIDTGGIKKSQHEMQTDVRDARNDVDNARGRLNRTRQDINNFQ